jgi:tetratricopeptide (TPR) repeat protein
MPAAWALLLGALALVLLGPGAPAPVTGAGGDEAPGRGPVGRPEDPEYATAVTAIKRGDFAAAARRLEGVVARDAGNADALNWLAYAIRKGGDPARSIPIYQKALALDPRHRGAHEYIGEAYLALNDVAKAREHLAALNRLCFFPCGEYRDLKKAVEDYEKGRAAR